MAAYNAGVKTVLIPNDNLRDMEELDPLARENLIFVPCKKIKEVLEQALLPLQKAEKESHGEHSSLAAFMPGSVQTHINAKTDA